MISTVVRPLLSRIVVIAVLMLLVATTACQSLSESASPTSDTETFQAPSTTNGVDRQNHSEPPPQNSYRLRGINIATFLTQAVTIYDHPNATGTGEPQSTYDDLARYGHRLIRLPFFWDYLQPNLDAGDQSFDRAYWRAIRAEVTKIGRAGMNVVLGLHNGCDWTEPRTTDVEPLVCGAGLSVDDTNQVWRRLSDAFGSDPTVIAYDLFNEPTMFNHPTREDVLFPGKQPYAVYKEHVNAVVDTIRRNNDAKDIWVQPLCCSRFLDFNSTDPDGGWVIDPEHNITYSQHMYPTLDSDEGEVFDPAKLDENYEVPAGSPWSDRGYVGGFLNRLEDFGNWCESSGARCSVGEVGWFGPGHSQDSMRQWNELGERWYALANSFGMAVTYWSASSAYQGNSWAYDAGMPDQWYPTPGIRRKLSPSEVIEKPENQSPR